MYVVSTNKGQSITSLRPFIGRQAARHHFLAMVEEDYDAVNLYEVAVCSPYEALQAVRNGDKTKCRLVHHRESDSYRISRLARDLDLDLDI